MPKCGINKSAGRKYWNHTLTWVFNVIFAAYFQNNDFYILKWSAKHVIERLTRFHVICNNISDELSFICVIYKNIDLVELKIFIIIVSLFYMSLK